MSRNARDSDLGYFILDTILCNLISLNVLHGDVKHHGVSSSPFLYQIFFNVACFRFRWHFFPTCSHTRRCPSRGPSSMFSRARSQLRGFVWAKIEKRTNCFRVIVLSIILIQTLAAGWLLFAVLWYPVHRRCFFIDNLVNPETERAREKNWRLFPPFPTPNSLRLRSINAPRFLFSDARSTIPKNKIQGQLTGHSLKVKVICSIWPLSTDTIWHHFRSRPSCEPYTE